MIACVQNASRILTEATDLYLAPYISDITNLGSLGTESLCFIADCRKKMHSSEQINIQSTLLQVGLTKER
jgi:hypothetical protein